MPAICRSARWSATLAAVVLALPACEAVQGPQPSPAPGPGFSPIRLPLDAGAIVHAAPDAAPPELAEVDDPKPWVFRKVSTGMIVTPRRWTSTLRRNGDRASFRGVVEGAPSDWGAGHAVAWSLIRSDTFVGTSHRDQQRTVFELASATGAQLRLTCRPDRLTVHRAGANLVRTPNFRDECGDTGVWRPPATQTVNILTCVASDPSLDPQQRHERDLGHWGQFGGTTVDLAPAPGVEALSVNDDCILQGGGYRLRSATD